MANRYPRTPGTPKDPADPVVAAGPPGSGTVRTKSGLFVDTTTGVYVKGPTDAAYGPNRPAGVPGGNRPDDRPGNQGAGPGGKTANMNPAQLKDLQRFLHNHGYSALQIDGKFGPITQAAIDDWHNGPGKRNPDAFNKKYAPAVKPPPNVKGPVGTDPSGTRAADDPAKDPPATDPTKGTLADLGPLSDLIGQISKTISGHNTDVMAANETNEMYNPLIAEGRRQEKLAGKQKVQDAKDIQSWFNTALNQNNAHKQDMKDNLSEISGDSSALMKNILASVGDDKAIKANIGRTALSNEGNLQGIGLADANLADNLHTALALRGRDEQNRQAKTDQGSIEDAKSALMQIIGQKGSALVGNTDKYRQEGIGNQFNLANLMSVAAMLPSQMQGASLTQMLNGLKIGNLIHPPAKQPTYKVFQLLADAAASMGLAQGDTKLKAGMTAADAARVIGNTLKGVKYLQPGSPTYRSLGYQILGQFQDADGKPLQPGKNWFTGQG